MRDAISAEYQEASEAGDPGSQAPATSEGDASREKVLMYAALLAHFGSGISKDVIVHILAQVSDTMQFHRLEVQKLVSGLSYIDIEDVINQPLVPEFVPKIGTEPEPEPEPEKPKPEPEEDYQGDMFRKLFG